MALWLMTGGLHASELRVGDTPRLPAVQTINDGTIDPAALRGKVVVISYFATTCPFCMNEAPKLQKLYRDNKDRLVVIGVNIQKNDPDQRSKVRQWVDKYKLTFPVTTEYEPIEAIVGRLKGLPVNQVLDRHGKVVRIDVGEIFDEDFDEIARLAQ
ncbi:MAG TPA: TlpA disulfide reductase family protein [Noviherbaspirillum sp.]|nr:TlpA disulfide reductase family protein [Noviherbaspirillum sp.]